MTKEKHELMKKIISIHLVPSRPIRPNVMTQKYKPHVLLIAALYSWQ